MNLITKLNLITASKQLHINPIQQKRNKLCIKLFEQMEIAKAELNGSNYSVRKEKTYTNKENGQSYTKEVNKRLRKWYWVNDSGKLNLQIKYGVKTLILNKDGSNAIEVKDKKELIDTLITLKDAVLNGELDSAIESVSEKTRNTFKK
jgi:hypothetical protein